MLGAARWTVVSALLAGWLLLPSTAFAIVPQVHDHGKFFKAETVKEASQLKGAIARARKAVVDGRPYLLDIDTYRDGIGAASTYHPTFSVAEVRKRRV